MLLFLSDRKFTVLVLQVDISLSPKRSLILIKQIYSTSETYATNGEYMFFEGAAAGTTM